MASRAPSKVVANSKTSVKPSEQALLSKLQSKIKQKKPPVAGFDQDIDDIADFGDELNALVEDGTASQWAGVETPGPDEQGSEEGSEDEEEGSWESDYSSSETSEEDLKDKFKYQDDASEVSEDREQRRYLIEKHSFLRIDDPDLSDALILKEKAIEKEYKGVRLEKHDYKKLCDELGVRPSRKFMECIDQEDMDLSWQGMTSKEIVAVCKMLCNNTHVLRLSLRGNACGREGGDAIAEMIENNHTITHLNLARSEIKPSMNKICEALTLNIIIESFDVSGNDLKNKDMEYMAIVLKESTSILELFLHHNLIEDHGLANISKGLFVNTSLLKLDLSYNRIRGEKVTIKFFKSIVEHPTLHHLNLEGNSMKDDPVRGIARVLSHNKNMDYVNISNNLMTGRVCGALGKGLSKSPTMDTFIAGPQVGSTGWQKGCLTQASLANMLQPLTNWKSEVPLKTLDLCFITSIHSQFTKPLNNLAKNKPEIKVIHGDSFGMRKFKRPDPQELVIKRAKVVCENFETPLEMLIDELRKEPKTMNEKDFKKFIKSCNLYKDRVMTQSFMENFKPAGKSYEIDCEKVISVYDRLYPKSKPADEKGETTEEGRGGGTDEEKALQRETDTSMAQMMLW